MKETRRVLTSRGFEYIEVDVRPVDVRPVDVRPIDVRPVEAVLTADTLIKAKEKMVANTERPTPVVLPSVKLPVDLVMPNVSEMSLVELKELAKSMGVKIGNRGLVKAREFMLSKFEVSEEEEL